MTPAAPPSMLPFLIGRGAAVLVVGACGAIAMVLAGAGDLGVYVSLVQCTTAIGGSVVITTGLEALALRRRSRYPPWLAAATLLACALWHVASCVHAGALLHLAQTGSVEAAIASMAAPEPGGGPAPGGAAVQLTWPGEALLLLAFAAWLLNFALISGLRLRASGRQVGTILVVQAVCFLPTVWVTGAFAAVLVVWFGAAFLALFAVQFLADVIVVWATGAAYPRFAGADAPSAPRPPVEHGRQSYAGR